MIKNVHKILAKVLHVPTLIILLGIAVFFSILIFQIFYEVVYEYFTGGMDLSNVLERIFLAFLFIEVIAAIKIYFSENYHFPLRFFVYIGITDMIRYIIVNHQDPNQVLLNTIAILLLIGGLSVLELKNYHLKNNKKTSEQINNDFEL